MAQKKTPMRRCVGCCTMFEKKSLIRVVRSSEGEVSLDFTGRKSGRGAYICNNPECLKKARKSKAFSRAFATDVPDGVYEALQAEMEAGSDEK